MADLKNLEEIENAWYSATTIFHNLHSGVEVLYREAYIAAEDRRQKLLLLQMNWWVRIYKNSRINSTSEENIDNVYINHSF